MKLLVHRWGSCDAEGEMGLQYVLRCFNGKWIDIGALSIAIFDYRRVCQSFRIWSYLLHLNPTPPFFPQQFRFLNLVQSGAQFLGQDHREFLAVLRPLAKMVARWSNAIPMLPSHSQSFTSDEDHDRHHLIWHRAIPNAISL